ncbi:MAG TPA: TetR-like C-terminal domain-containing protein [Kribbella sp.]|nr:TetR-like C-terminal domain-containing protein [Kribbella sp.]
MFKDLVAQLWQQRPFSIPTDEQLGADLVHQLNRQAGHFAHMPAGAVYLTLNYWTRLYGLICMEVFGRLHWALDDAGAYFEARLREIGDALGLECPPPTIG